MPRLKQTDGQRRADRFSEHYRVGKARLKLKEPDIARILGVSEPTLSRYKNGGSPLAKFSFEAVVTLGQAFGWSDEDYLDIIRGGKMRN